MSYNNRDNYNTYFEEQNTLPENTAIMVGGRSLADDPLYIDVMRRMQVGDWQEVLPMMQMLKAQYPDESELDTLIHEATLKAEFDSNWKDKIKGRRLSIRPLRVLMKVVPIALVALLVVGGVLYYGQMQRVNASAAQLQARMEQALSALQAGQPQQALDIYNEIFGEDPDNTDAQKGIVEAKKQISLFNEYELGKEAMDAGSYGLALGYFTSLENKAPGYRDVAAMINRLQSTAKTEQIFKDAEAAYSNERWQDAIKLYEALKSVDATYENATVKENLTDAYMRAGLQIVSRSSSNAAEMQSANEFFRKVLSVRVGDAEARLESEMVTKYLTGKEALDQNDLPAAVDAFAEVYQKRPLYLGGLLTQQLYDAFLTLGQQAEQAGKDVDALAYYGKAAALLVNDRSKAIALAEQASFRLTPTPTPVPTATRRPLTMNDFKGWIGFLSNRDGIEVAYVMRPDGSNQQIAPPRAQDQLLEIYANEQWSPDRKSQLFVYTHVQGDTKNINIKKVRVDLPENWKRETVMTEFPGTEYDPVWSPDNKKIAFVANHTPSDEIWIMSTEGTDYKQLTHNGWEWDKHPTWSDDGQRLYFFSNRSGTRQIWMMNADGSNQVNISNNEYDDWDPVWIR